jgi:hypothetical protein
MTTTTNPFTGPAKEIERDRWGRPLVIPPGGGKPVGYTRATTFVDCLEDKSNLMKWKARMAAVGLAARPDLQLAVAATPVEDKRKLDALIEEACEAAGASASATIGTAIHAFTERLDRGEELTNIPPAYLADIEAYKQATAPLTVVQIETFGVVDSLKVGGTWDRIVNYRGRNYIADLKTGSIEYGLLKIAMQLGLYANAEQYDHTNGARAPLPDVDKDRAIIIHLPAGAGTCELVWVDIRRGWEAVQTAAKVREWRALKDLGTPFQDTTEPVLETVHAPEGLDVDAALTAAINAATTGEELSKLWEENQTIWGQHHTEAAKARKATLAA